MGPYHLQSFGASPISFSGRWREAMRPPVSPAGARNSVTPMRLGRIRGGGAESVSSGDLHIGVDIGGAGERSERLAWSRDRCGRRVLKYVSYSARTLRRWRALMMRIRSNSSRRTLPTLARAENVIRAGERAWLSMSGFVALKDTKVVTARRPLRHDDRLCCGDWPT